MRPYFCQNPSYTCHLSQTHSKSFQTSNTTSYWSYIDVLQVRCSCSSQQRAFSSEVPRLSARIPSHPDLPSKASNCIAEWPSCSQFPNVLQKTPVVNPETYHKNLQVQVKVTPKSCLQLSPNVNASQKVTPKSFLLVSPNGYAAPLESWNGKTYQLSCSSARQGILSRVQSSK